VGSIAQMSGISNPPRRSDGLAGGVALLTGETLRGAQFAAAPVFAIGVIAVVVQRGAKGR